MSTCNVCRRERVTHLLDLGMQPVCNRFLTTPADEEYRHRLVMEQCDACGVIQLIHPVPARELLPPYDWIRYKEPEGHLDQVAQIICGLPNLTKDSIICGVSYKDDSTVERLRKRGFNHTWRIESADGLGITDPRAGIETIQDRLCSDVAGAVVQRYGTSDVVIARHILEHAHDTLRFMEALHQLVKPEGYVVFEVPDCTRALEAFDCTMLWEEHILYFTPETFRQSFGFGGFSSVRFECYPYPNENSLVGIVQLQGEATTPSPPGDVLENEKRRAFAFGQALTQQRQTLRRLFSEYRRNHGRIAVFGAGHIACMFINLMELGEHIDFVVDDDPKKQGLLMPGSRLPIASSSILMKENIKLCLMGLSPESEEKVILRNQTFRDRGGVFASIFSPMVHALQI